MRRLFLFALLLCSTLVHAEPTELDWLELMPKEDQLALEAMPEISHDSPEAAGSFGQQGGLKQELGLPAVMYSTKTVARLDGKRIRLGGYPVPLESDAEGRTTLLFLVPYPGACIHVPPPPSNQIVYVTSELGVQLDDLYQPFWIEGPLKVGSHSSEMGTAGYQMAAEKIYPYEM